MPDRLGAADAGPVLALASTGRDAEGAARLLGREGVACQVCLSLEVLSAAIGEETGAVLIAEEALARADLAPLARRLAAQPPWSDLPFVVLTQGGAAARRTLVELRLPEVMVEAPAGWSSAPKVPTPGVRRTVRARWAAAATVCQGKLSTRECQRSRAAPARGCRLRRSPERRTGCISQVACVALIDVAADASDDVHKVIILVGPHRDARPHP